jgi:hypothetical protein
MVKTPQQPKRRIWLWVLSSVLAVVGVILGILGFLVYQAYSLGKTVTSEDPVSLPIASPSEVESQNLDQRFAVFQGAIATNQPAQLILTAMDLNAIVAQDPQMAGKVYFQIEDDRLLAKGSVPLNDVPGLAGRFLNGTIHLKLNLQDGKLEIQPTQIDFANTDVPPFIKQAVLDSIKQQNLAQGIESDPQLKEWLKNIKTVKIQSGQIIVTR